MTRRLRSTRTRVIAGLLAAVTALLAPAIVFGAMPTSHACSATHSGAAIVSASAPHAGAPCQHSELGCLMRACAGPALISLDGGAAAVVVPVVVIESPAGAALPAGPRSAPPTPPPNR